MLNLVVRKVTGTLQKVNILNCSVSPSIRIISRIIIIYTLYMHAVLISILCCFISVSKLYPINFMYLLLLLLSFFLRHTLSLCNDLQDNKKKIIIIYK